MNLLLPRSSLLTIHKSFVRPHLDYRYVIYDTPNNSLLSGKTDKLNLHLRVKVNLNSSLFPVLEYSTFDGEC